ncbi:hypothetical protein CU097_015403 [Rhizopus azygosporus]|uniref:BHLH domain-containing protein n=1 Tax=Rhizopus azygosporus TaxID=86630 RepID=A0A367K948_RHIAZ|nr:hypothetical protein CU097_015403 [Rhizopus azygosporus]
MTEDNSNHPNQLYFDYHQINTNNANPLLFNEIMYQQDYQQLPHSNNATSNNNNNTNIHSNSDALSLSHSPLLFDNSSSSCTSSPSVLYETATVSTSSTAATRQVSKKQTKKKVINSELKRQIHIQSEQKRRAQIKDGFDELRNQLPSCLNKKMSKVALLHRTVQHIQHLKSTQTTILAELERLVAENERLRKFKESVLQNQALEKMYSL